MKKKMNQNRKLLGKYSVSQLPKNGTYQFYEYLFGTTNKFIQAHILLLVLIDRRSKGCFQKI